jgi:DnaJ-class molecular chaperone
MHCVSANPFIHHAGFVDVIKGEGMPKFGTDFYGDLYVEYKVILPLELSPNMRRSKFLLRPILTNLMS